MSTRVTKRISSITEFHRSRGLPSPEHPLISIIDYSEIQRPKDMNEVNWVFDFYQISLKRGINGKLRYGQQQYDFDEGILFFISPNQVFRIEPLATSDTPPSGWMLLVHPNFLWNSNLAQQIKTYDFFDYYIHEALFLSLKEEQILQHTIALMQQEYKGTMDKFSQKIIITHLETLLSYAERFYERQFITRKITNHDILSKLESQLENLFAQQDLITLGLPAVQSLAENLNISPNYLSRILNTLTGMSTQQYIQAKLIEQAKLLLSTTHKTVAEIAYSLGFAHPQSFTKLFKRKTNLSPLAFRATFN